MSELRRAVALLVCLGGVGIAHVGSPDIYLDGNAGPYQLFVTIRPPQVIPGVAEILVRCQSPGVTEMKAVPLPLSGPGAEHPPVPDLLSQSSSDAQFFSGSLWLMTDGSWQVRIFATGGQGPGTLSVPVPAVAQRTRGMDASLSVILSVLALFLVAGLAAICSATVREAKLQSGDAPSDANKRKGRIAMVVAFCVIGAILFGGKLWWDSESNVYQQRIYKPLNMQAQLENGFHLNLKLSEPGWMQPQKNSQAGRINRVLFVRQLNDLVPDHNHLMHLYALREPGFDVIYHLHPEQLEPDQFQLDLPAMPPGDYKLYADVVHENGLPETLTSSLHLPVGVANAARPLAGDDARAETKPLGAARSGDTFVLPDGYRMHWIHNGSERHAREGSQFEFELLTPDGGKPDDMALYMGMLGHAAFVKTDGTTFAHVHPNGTVSMSAFMLAQRGGTMDSMNMTSGRMPNTVSFPYGLPSPGAYRIFVQMKHGDTIETGVFDAVAE